MTTPAVCILDKPKKKAMYLFFGQGLRGRNFGVTLEQKGNRLEVLLTAPARRRLVYRIYDGFPSLEKHPEADPPMRVEAGEEIVIPYRIFVEDCESIPDLFHFFVKKQTELYEGEVTSSFPFSAFWKLSEDKRNRKHFNEEDGFYTMDGLDAGLCGQWQAGWV